jgi:2-polyprenyl-6-methoxyphenol hydroxylase-like FAD-dependent oxidoreductase
MKTQVIIAGAGPTGLSLAAQFIRYNIDFIIYDKDEGITPLSKALSVHARTLEVFEQFGIADRAVAQGQILSTVKMNVNGEKQGEFDLATLGGNMSSYPFLLILEQSKTEKLLYDFLTESGKIVHWNTELIDFEQDTTGVKATLKNADGTSQTIEADYLVGCDGARSVIRQKLGFTFDGGTFEQFFYVADTKIDWNLGYGKDLNVCVGKNSFVAFFPMKGDQRTRIIGILPDTHTEDKKVEFADLEQKIKHDANIPLEISDVGWFSIYKVHTRMTNCFYKNRCFIAGDAAHIHSPAGGQGMNTGIQDAYNLAWKLAMVLKGEAKMELLDSYNTERLENAKNLIQTTDNLFQLEAGSGWFMSIVRMYVLPLISGFMLKRAFIKKRFFPTLSQIGIKYPNSILTQESKISTIKAGDRMPYFTFKNGMSIYDYLKNPNFHLISFGKKMVGDMPDFVEKVHFDEAPKAIFNGNTDFHILVRPDNYIAYIGKDEKAINRYLDEKIKISA